MRSRLGLATVVLAVLAAACASDPPAPVPEAAAPTPEPLTLVWSDEFDGPELDLSKWWTEHSTYGTGGGSIHCYVPDNVTLQNGMVLLTARAESVTCPDGTPRSYTSGMIRTEGLASFTYGRIEVRLRAPEGQGLWSAAWMGPETRAYGAWPASGEIDLIEILGDQVNLGVSSLHWADEAGQPDKATAEVDLSDGFHTYAVTWTPDEIVWDVDGEIHHRVDSWRVPDGAQFPAPFDQPFAIRLNLAVGGNWPGDPTADTPLPSSLEIDWVRVYELPDAR